MVEKIYPSNTNFFLMKVRDANRTYKSLKAQHIIVRNRHQYVENCLRITVGNSEENNQLIKALKNEKSTVFR